MPALQRGDRCVFRKVNEWYTKVFQVLQIRSALFILFEDEIDTNDSRFIVQAIVDDQEIDSLTEYWIYFPCRHIPGLGDRLIFQTILPLFDSYQNRVSPTVSSRYGHNCLDQRLYDGSSDRARLLSGSRKLRLTINSIDRIDDLNYPAPQQSRVHVD